MDIMGHVSSDGESSLVSGLVQLPLTLSLGADDGMPRFPDKTCFYGCSDADGWGPMSLKYADFTPCFLQGFVGTLVAVTTIGCALWYSYSLCSKAKKRHNRLTGYFFIKLSLIGISTFFNWSLFIRPQHTTAYVWDIFWIYLPCWRLWR